MRIFIFLLLIIFPTIYSNGQIFQWINKIGMDGTGNDSGKAIEIDGDGNACVVGLVKNDSRFGSGSGAVILNGYGTHDAFLAKYDNSGNFIWARRHGSISNDSGQDLALDSQGRFYSVGYYSDIADFWDTTLVSEGAADVFIMSTDENGNFRWVTTLNGPLEDQGLSISMGADSMLYISGYFTNKIYYNNYEDSLIGFGSSDVFLAKINQAGKIVWIKNFGSFTDDQVSEIQFYQNRIYLTGYFKSTANFNGVNITASVAKDVFIACVDTSGVGVWVKKESSNKNDMGNSIFIKDSTIFVYMESNFNLNISGNQYAQFGSTAVGNIDGYLVKYDINGNYIESRQIASKFKDYPGSVFADDRFVYVGGLSEGNVHIEGADSLTNTGGEDFFMIAFDWDLNKKWHKQISNTQYSGKFPSMHDIAIDTMGSLFLTGGFLDTAYFDSILMTGSGWSVDVYIGKLSPAPMANVANPIKTACLGDTILFTNNSNYSTIVFNWYFPGSTTPHSTDSNPSIMYNSPGVYDYYLIVSDGLNSDSIYYASAIDIAYPDPLVQLGNDTSICYNQELLLQLDSIQYNEFNWNTGETSSAILANSIGDYYAEMKNNSGCQVNSDTIHVDYYPTNFPATLGPDTTLCPDTEMILTADSGFSSYFWQDASTDNFFNVNSAGDYHVELIDINGCVYQSDSIQVNYFPSSFPYIGTDTIICSGNSILLTTNEVYSSYVWSTGEFTSSILTNLGGLYFVEVMDQFGCSFHSDTISVIIDPCLSVSSRQENELKFINSSDNIKVISEVGNISKVEWMTTEGKLIGRSMVNDTFFEIDLSDYPKQIFILIVYFGDEIFIQKF